MNDYEQERAERIAENKKRIEELGLQQALSQLTAAPSTSSPPQGRKRSRKQATPERQIRRSERERKQVSYREPEYELHGQGSAAIKRRLVVNVEDEEELARLRAAVAAADAAEGSASKKRGPVDSGKGVRIQGGKVYDSKYGVTCHWCRQKTLENHVTCTQEDCGKGRRLPVTFCYSCLRNRHGEDGALAHASKSWVCPVCRGNCGPGCILCCNCGPCRKKAGLEPTHQVVKLARQAGYDNVHDYLVHLARPKESPEEIVARKAKFPWGQWMVQGGGQAAPSTDDPDADEGSHDNSQEAADTHLTQEGSAPAPSSEDEKPVKSRTRGQKALTDVYKAGKPGGAAAAKTKRGKRPVICTENEEPEDNEANEVQVQDTGLSADQPAKAADTTRLTRKQRIQMSLGLGAVPVSA